MQKEAKKRKQAAAAFVCLMEKSRSDIDHILHGSSEICIRFRYSLWGIAAINTSLPHSVAYHDMNKNPMMIRTISSVLHGKNGPEALELYKLLCMHYTSEVTNRLLLEINSRALDQHARSMVFEVKPNVCMTTP